MTSQQNNLIPEIFVLWHPDCRLGEPLAKRIYAWLRPENGLGPQVFYRSLPAPQSPAKGLPLPLPKKLPDTTISSNKISHLQILLPLIDENMVADPAWRHWLKELYDPNSSSTSEKKLSKPSIPSAPKSEILPVALDATAYNIENFRKLNYLRPAGLPLPTESPTDGDEFELIARSLLKQLTEAMCRLMLPGTGNPKPDTYETMPKVTIFLSHAKVDGKVPARRLRDYIYSETQLAAFYDENDIPLGSTFSSVIERRLDSPETTALIVIRSTQYSGRPWCRRELSLFRKPEQEKNSAGEKVPHWYLFPTLVVDALEGRTSSAGIPELGNSPIIQWSDDEKNIEELIITTIIRDAMLASIHSAMGASIPLGNNRIIINWRPDPTTLLHVFSGQPPQNETEVVYPGRGLSLMELGILVEFFPYITFLSFEEVLSEEVLLWQT